MPIQLAKTVRFRMSQLKEVMARMPDLRVIALFRDPRGILRDHPQMTPALFRIQRKERGSKNQNIL